MNCGPTLHSGIWLLASLAIAGCATAPDRATASASVPKTATAEPSSARPMVALQARRDWRFGDDGVRFDNRLPGARLSAVTRLGAGHYRVDVEPEIHPVNPSPWYGFRIRADVPRQVRIDFRYAGYKHRYRPKLSLDGAHWRAATAQEFAVDERGQASLQVMVGPQALQVFAQPPFGPEDFDDWVERVARGIPIERRRFGRSVQGRPLQLFEFGGDADAPVVVVLGRQHPPENTGSQALIGFVETLAADTPAAHRYRRDVRTLVIPILNPDGVLEGHWRTNLRGKDLNRDWGPFTEPETQALREALPARIDGQGRRAVFIIDFHSTFRDVLYTVAEDPSRAPGGTLRRWIDAMQTRFPGRIEEKAYAATSSVFKNWAYCRFGAPAITYEVGDTTPAATLDALSRHAAEALMSLLSQDLPDHPAPGPGCAAAATD